MSTLLPYVLDRIEAAEPKHGRKLRRQLESMDEVFRSRAEDFFGRYGNFITAQHESLDFGVDCYLKLRVSMMKERILFLKTGRYRNGSFEEVNRSVYNHPEAMREHMHGLVFAQFLWPDQYRRYSFFCEGLPRYAAAIRRYLEIGGGHALYLGEALRILGGDAEFDLVDVSPTSIELAQGIVCDPRVRYHLLNIFDYSPGQQYDFITMGEVIEHVERPVELLEKVRSLLAPSGRAYITTPANAPMPDHIYLFRDEEEIRQTLREAGFEIETEALMYEDDLPPEQAKAQKAALMYSAFVKNA